jgi:DNA uptake protein ComE-like DNA-binding protein
VFQRFDSHTGGGNVAGVFLVRQPVTTGRPAATPGGNLIVPTPATWRALTAAVLLSMGWQAQAAMPAAAAAAPGTAASAVHAAQRPGSGPQAARPSRPAKLVDLNKASKSQLMKLPGIGDAEAERIIAKRPFNSKAAIVTDAGIPAGVFLAIKRSIFVGPVAQPKPKPKA